MRIVANKLLNYSTEELWEGLIDNFTLVFDDGEILTTKKETIYSSYVWDFHRRYTSTNLSVKHHVSSIINDNNRLGVSTHLYLINTVLWSVFDRYNSSYTLIDELTKYAYVISNNMYNELTYKLEEYVTTLDITDFISITTNNVLVKAMTDVEPSQEGIDKLYTTIKDQLKNNNELKGNTLVKIASSGIVSMNQLLQCVGVRGYLTDMDNHLFKEPIMRGFVHGIRSFHDILIETRSSAKALINSKSPLSNSEYFSRKQQLICQNVQNLHYGDCGSTNYINWLVRDSRFSNDEDDEDDDINDDLEDTKKKTKVAHRYQTDLNTIAGKYYLDEDTNTLKIVKITDTHLLGKYIKLRSVIAGCSHPDPVGVCEVCYGETALSIPPRSNLGHINCTILTAELGQLILSTKHFEGSSVIEGIVLNLQERKWLNIQKDNNMYYLNKPAKHKSLSLMFSVMSVPGITDLKLVDSVFTLSLPRVSEFKEIGIICNDLKTNESITEYLKVSLPGRLSSMSHDLLNYIIYKGVNIDSIGNYILNMDEWNYTLPILSLPLKHFSMALHQTEIAELLGSTVKERINRGSKINPHSLLIDLHDLINRRLSIPLSAIEITLYSSMGVDPINNDFSLPKTNTTAGVGVMCDLLNSRSLSATMGYEGHREVLLSPSSYIHKNRVDHIYDTLILPNLVKSK